MGRGGSGLSSVPGGKGELSSAPFAQEAFVPSSGAKCPPLGQGGGMTGGTRSCCPGQAPHLGHRGLAGTVRARSQQGAASALSLNLASGRVSEGLTLNSL